LFTEPEAMPASSAAVRVKPGDTALTRTPARTHSAGERLRRSIWGAYGGLPQPRAS
jgi:hypothetical protein